MNRNVNNNWHIFFNLLLLDFYLNKVTVRQQYNEYQLTDLSFCIVTLIIFQIEYISLDHLTLYTIQ